LEVLQNTPLCSPIYIAISGINDGEGAVVTRNRDSTADTWSLDAGTGRWFLAQTNDDHWGPPIDPRRDALNKWFIAAGRAKVSLDVMFGFLSTPPVLSNWTTYTTKLFALDGTSSTVIQGF